jgi:putative membrane protein
MRHLLPLTLLIANCFIADGQTSTGTKTGSSTRTPDQIFLRQAAQGNLAEIQLGELAQKNGSSQVVKQFGQRMVTDHTNLIDKVKSLASSKGFTLPISPSAKDQATYRTLASKTGSDFDKAYITDMINDHTHDINDFEQESNSGADPDIRALASQALPTLQVHLRQAENAAQQLGISTNPSGPGQ